MLDNTVPAELLDDLADAHNLRWKYSNTFEEET
jgi:hypothetical protein